MLTSALGAYSHSYFSLYTQVNRSGLEYVQSMPAMYGITGFYAFGGEHGPQPTLRLVGVD